MNTKHRRSIRLKGYDYSQAGAYFVTICTHKRDFLFGEVVDGEMRANEFGCVVSKEWFGSADIRAEIKLYPDEFVVMPNHIHGIVWILDHVGATGPRVGAHGRAPLQRPPRSLGAFVAGFKSAVTKRINMMRGTPGAAVWQRGYYEHIIRDDESLNRIREYILQNPLRWHLDLENPQRAGEDDLWRMFEFARMEGAP
jgi:REP element-mobilizing transposase RayT